MKITRLLLLTLYLILSTTACQAELKEFQPEANSLFKITFSYPASWNWEEDIPYDDVFPLDELPPSERIVFHDGPISIQVFKPSNPQAEMQKFIDIYLRAIGNTLSSDATIQIDGYNARWLTVVSPPLTTSDAQVSEVIYLPTEDRYYVIHLSIPESETNDRFHREFKKLIKTIKVLP